jgi:predicted DNA-binding transcriptional regulator AlpA
MQTTQPGVTGRKLGVTGRRWATNTELAAYFGISVMTIWNWQRDPNIGFPQPSRVGRRDFTDLDEIDGWMRRRVVIRNQAKANPENREAASAR